MSSKKIATALISVFDKEGLEPVVRSLNALNIKLISTGGTKDFIEKLNIPVVSLEKFVQFPSILGGRVKTLHPKVFGGILNRQNNPVDQEELAQYNIENIDLVIVDLYPFEKTLENTKNDSEIIEKIDIGGISLIRAAAKNFNDVVCIASKEKYNSLLEVLNAGKGITTLKERKYFASHAFYISSQYDTAIFHYFSNNEKIELRYGENPHQKAFFRGNLDQCFKQLNGKSLSYNNLLDIDAAINLIFEFRQESFPTFAILKHNNACGVATRNTVLDAYKEALSCDPISAFGGILVTSHTIDYDTAIEIKKIFCEILIAPNFFRKSFADIKE